MDLSKEFDLVSWEHLFLELMERGVSPLFLRCLLFIYSSQTCNVMLEVCIPMFIQLETEYIYKYSSLQGVYLGIWVYEDDIILLSPSRFSLQSMTNIYENSAKLKFSPHPVPEKSKNKCLIFTKENINMND